MPDLIPFAKVPDLIPFAKVPENKFERNIYNKGPFCLIFEVKKEEMFSKACEYGIRALTVIAKKGQNDQRIGIKELCKLSQTPESFTSKILQNLVKKKIINSRKGPTGGFFIEKDLDSITLKEIVIAIDGEDMFVQCGLGFDECSAVTPCPLHNQFAIVRNELDNMCKGNTLQDLVNGFGQEIYKK